MRAKKALGIENHQGQSLIGLCVVLNAGSTPSASTNSRAFRSRRPISTPTNDPTRSSSSRGSRGR